MLMLGVLGMLQGQPSIAQQGERDPWLVVLRQQLRQSHNCTLAEVLFVRELPLGQDFGVEGRVSCLEGREYDFTRQRAHQKFDIRLCLPVVC